jgi:hypothetical protein
MGFAPSLGWSFRLVIDLAPSLTLSLPLADFSLMLIGDASNTNWMRTGVRPCGWQSLSTFRRPLKGSWPFHARLPSAQALTNYLRYLQGNQWVRDSRRR